MSLYIVPGTCGPGHARAPYAPNLTLIFQPSLIRVTDTSN